MALRERAVPVREPTMGNREVATVQLEPAVPHRERAIDQPGFTSLQPGHDGHPATGAAEGRVMARLFRTGGIPEAQVEFYPAKPLIEIEVPFD
jgi:hypothetical protein